MKRMNFLNLLGIGALLALLAAVYQQELADDSYQHFQTSVVTLAAHDWHFWIVDLWNKPLPTLLYGIPGQGGLWPARLASVILVMSTLGMLAGLAQQIWGQWLSRSLGVMIVAFLFQFPVLAQSFVTMTELPAAFLLTLGLWLYARQKRHWAFLALGFLPWARMECALMMAYLFACLSLYELRKDRPKMSLLLALMGRNMLGSLPFVLWWGGGWWQTGKLGWMSEKSYAVWRGWEALAWAKVNAWNALPSVVVAPLLFWAFLGIWYSWHSLSKSQEWQWFLWASGGCLGLHLLFLSGFVVYPLEVYGNLGVAAINARNFNVLSPWLALLSTAGMLAWAIWLAGELSLSFKVIGICGGLTQIALLGFWGMQQMLGTSLEKGWFKLGLGTSLLGGMLIWSFLNRKFKTKPVEFWLKRLSLLGMGGVFLSQPFFWYPLRWQDQREWSQTQFCQWATPEIEAGQVPRLVQDLNGRLDRFCGWSGIDATWIWPTAFPHLVEISPPGSWILLETTPNGQPDSRYPATWLAEIQNSPQFILRQSLAPRLPQGEEKLFMPLTARNWPRGWLLYEKQASSP